MTRRWWRVLVLAGAATAALVAVGLVWVLAASPDRVDLDAVRLRERVVVTPRRAAEVTGLVVVAAGGGGDGPPLLVATTPDGRVERWPARVGEHHRLSEPAAGAGAGSVGRWDVAVLGVGPGPAVEIHVDRLDPLG